MTGEHPQPAESDLLEAYLDGQLEGAPLIEFEARLAASAELREAVALQQRIDQALGRLFREPDRPAHLHPARRRLIHPAILALAASIAILTAAVWIFVAMTLTETRNRLGPLYHETIAAGFEPQIVCTTPDEFAAWVQTNYGQPLYPKDDPGIEYVGWSYANIVSGYSGVLLAYVDGKEVVVVIDQREREHARQARPDDRSLSIHRRTIGDLVLYEVTPHGRARVLPVLSRETR